MPTKTYEYKVKITNTVDNRGVKSGTDEIEKQLTKTEKRALKMIETIKKAFEILEKSGINTAKIEAAQSRIIVADEKALRAIRASEAQKQKLTEQTRREQIKTSEMTQRAAERAASAQVKAARDVAREEQRSFQSRAKFLLDQQTREERFNQARFRSAQQYYRELERQSNLEAKRAAQNERALKQNSQRRIENVSMVGGGLQNAGLTATAIATAPIVAGFYAAIKAGSEYETSMNTLQAVTNATAEEMKRAGDLAVRLGNDISLPGVSALDASEAMTELGKAGLTVSQAMAAAKGTLQLATAANISAGQAAEITANALNMFRLRAEEAGRVADLLAGAANASSAEITDVAASLQQAGSVFAAANVPIEDTVALIAEMANQGIKGSDAGTSLKTMMQRLQSPTDNAADAMKKLNIEIFDQQGRMRPMREIIGQFEKSLGNLTEQQKAQALNTIFGADAVRAANIVFGEGVKGFDKMSEAVQRSNAAAELAAARTKGLAGSWEALKSQAETLGLIIFNRIKEPLTEVVLYIATFASAVTEAFLNLPEPVQKFIIALAAVAAAVGPILTIIGTFVVALGSVASGLTALAGTATVGAAISALAPIIAGIVIVIAGLTAGISAAIAVVYGLSDAWENGFGPVASIVAVGAAAILSAISPVLGIPVLIGAMLVTLYKIWETNFGGLRDLAQDSWKTIVDVASEALSEINRFVGEIGGEIVAWWRANYPFIQQIVETVNNSISASVQTFLDAVSNLWNAHGTTIRGVVSYIWEAIKTTVTFAVKIVGDILTVGLQLINGDWEAAWNSFLVIVRRTAKFVTETITGMNSLITRAIIAIGKWLLENSIAILKKIGEITGTGLKYIVLIIAALPVVLIKMVPKFLAAGMQIGSAIWQGIKDGISGNSGAENSTDLGIDVDSLFNLPENPLENVAAGVENLTKKMEKLGEVTEKTTGKTAVFNKEMADSGGKSRKIAGGDLDNLREKFFVGQKLGIGDAVELRKNLEALASDPKVQLFLETVRIGEGGAPNIFVGGRRVNNYSKHFGEQIPRSQWFDGPAGKSSASGSYQITLTNWRDIAPKLGLEDFSPKNQAIAALELMRRGGGSRSKTIENAFLSLASGDVETAFRKGTQDWASSNFSTLPGGKRDYLKISRQLLATGKFNGKTDIYEAPKNFDELPESKEMPSTNITTQPVELTQQQQFLQTLDERFNITKRQSELDQRRSNLATEILAKENDYILALQEAQIDLQVETKLLEKRNLSFEAANELTRQQNAQTRELGDIEIALSVLRKQKKKPSKFAKAIIKRFLAEIKTVDKVGCE